MNFEISRGEMFVLYDLLAAVARELETEKERSYRSVSIGHFGDEQHEAVRSMMRSLLEGGS